MRVGISEIFSGYDGRDRKWLIDAATLIEEVGFGGIWLPEHVVFFPSYESAYPYGTMGETEVHALKGNYDPFIAAAAIAMVTNRVRLGTYVCVIGQRNPVITARQVAVVDQLCEGRFDLGVGVGWSEEEYRALDVPFEKRGARLDEYLEAMKALWTQEISEYHGEFADFGPLLAYPKPTATPHPPIIVGGNSAATIRRIVAHGDGWAGYNLTIPEVERFVTRLTTALEAAGRSRDEVTLRVGRRAKGRTEQDWQDDASYLRQCEAVGLDEVVVSPRIPTENYEAMTRRYAEIIGLSA